MEGRGSRAARRAGVVVAAAVLGLAGPTLPGPVPSPGPAALAAQTLPDLDRARTLTARAIEAYREEDFTTFRDLLGQAMELRPPHPTLVYNLAAAHARTGDPDRALGLLDRAAVMGLAIDPGDDPDFGGIDPDRLGPVRDRLLSNADPVGRADTAFTFGPPDLIPEGIAHDPVTGTFYVSSIRHGSILAVSPDSAVRELNAAGRPRRGSTMGMAVHAGDRRLWVATSVLPQRRDADSAAVGRATLLAFDLDTGRPAAAYPVPGPGRHVLGDLALAPDGTVFATDAGTGAVLRLDPGAEALRTLVEPGTLASPQGLVVDPGGRLLVADYSLGLIAVDTTSGAVRLLEQPADIALVGIDGLVAHGADLIAVQNGFPPHRVIRIRLADDGLRVRDVDVLAASLPAFDEPTLAVLVHDALFLVANSQWNRFDGPTLNPDPPLTRPVILRLPL
jgi:sugar lactone lactonase YvrE